MYTGICKIFYFYDNTHLHKYIKYISKIEISQSSILVFNLDLTGKLGESGPNLDLDGVNLDLSDQFLTS